MDSKAFSGCKQSEAHNSTNLHKGQGTSGLGLVSQSVAKYGEI